MPLRAIINGDSVTAPLLNDEEWASLRDRVKADKLDVRMTCCDNVGYLRTSKHGFHHFVHKVRGDCTSKPETWQHLKVKGEIVRACRDAGYEASTEVDGDGWRADILATKGDIKIAFEVQWSPQTLETTLERQEKYAASGVRCCWLFKSPPQMAARADLPLFKLEVTEDTPSNIQFGEQGYRRRDNYGLTAIPLATFVQDLLRGRVRHCEQLRSQSRQKLRIVFIEIACWKCKRPYHVYYMSDVVTGCGHRLQSSDGLWENEKFYFAPEIRKLVSDFVASPDGSHLKLGPIRKRYSKTVGHQYLSFGCPRCNAICGDFFLHHQEIPRARAYESSAPAILETELNLSSHITHEHPHWCYLQGEEFCCKR